MLGGILLNLDSCLALKFLSHVNSSQEWVLNCMYGLPGAEIAMADPIIIELSSDSSDFDEEDDVSSADSSVAGSSTSGSSGPWATSVSGPRASSDSESVAYCQCEEGTLVECPACGSFFDIDTKCPLSL